ncbi:LCP family protein [Micromonospora echinofusca]|uniref:LytR family transcriptional regulator n=1 Tax=Micromonospora echinofusca TaxID=47858 RepID=A0ABS3VR73_MICEH|nr:LCP family protein [Micromonospora echinofusca]MBO4207039.1 LytR family transcriptional regulator [Micromonospora echinofusca]
MIEDELRSAFVRHERSIPPVGPLRAAIDLAVQRRRRQRSRLRVAGAALAVLLAVAVGVPLAVADRERVPAGPGNLLGDRATPAAPAGPLNLLLLGLDGGSDDPALRADSVLLVHLPADRSGMYLIALPRDLTVPVPGGGERKLNSVFTVGMGGAADRSAGWELTRQAVTDLTGVPIDAGATLTYPALRKLTDELDGVPLCLPRKVRSVHTGRTFPAGCQHLDGAAALDLLRQRLGLPDGAQDRDRHAQIFAAALFRRAGDRDLLSEPAGLFTLLRTLGDHLTVAGGETGVERLVAEAPRLADGIPVVAVDLPVTVSGAGQPFAMRLDTSSADPLLAALRTGRLADWARAHPDRATVE